MWHTAFNNDSSTARQTIRSVVLSLLLLILIAPAFAADNVNDKTAPPLHGTYLDGASFNLQNMRGKVVIVSFWASWCPGCREEMPVLETLYKKYHAQGLEIIGISLDEADKVSDIKKVIQNYSYPTAQMDAVHAEGYGRIWHLPMTFVIDRNGVLRKNAWQGDPKIYLKKMDALINPLIAAR